MDQTQPQREPITIQLFDLGVGRDGLPLPRRPSAVGSQWRALFLHRNHQIGQQTFEIRHCQRLSAGIHRVGAQAVVDTGLVAALGVDRRQLVGDPGTSRGRR